MQERAETVLGKKGKKKCFLTQRSKVPRALTKVLQLEKKMFFQFVVF